MDEIFRPKSNYVWAGVSLTLIGLFAVNSVLVVESSGKIFMEALFCLCLGGVVYLIWIKPKLIFGDEQVIVVNPVRTEVIAYSDIIDLETKWTLTIIHGHRKTKVWVAPASGKRGWIAEKKFGWYGNGLPLSESRDNVTQAMSESLASASGQAAYLIRERIKRAH